MLRIKVVKYGFVLNISESGGGGGGGGQGLFRWHIWWKVPFGVGGVKPKFRKVPRVVFCV